MDFSARKLNYIVVCPQTMKTPVSVTEKIKYCRATMKILPTLLEVDFVRANFPQQEPT